MKLTDYRLLGTTGLRVSPLCLGAMTFGTQGARSAGRDESLRMLEYYAAQGGNFIDSANIYGNGESESIVGEFMRSERSRFVIATKYSMGMVEGQPNTSGNHRKNMRESIDASLRRLGTDYVDLYWVHIWDFRSSVEEVMRGLDDLVRQGKVLYVAISDTPAWKISEANTLARCRNWTPFMAMQAEYHLIDRSAERDLVPMCRDQGVVVMPWSPLAGGLLSGKYGAADQHAPTPDDLKKMSRKAGLQSSGAINERSLKIVAALQAVARDLGASCSQVALAWLLAQPSRPLPICGARTLVQLRDNLGCMDVTLSAAQLATLADVSRIEPGFPNRLYQSARLRSKLVERNTSIEHGMSDLYADS